jgi:hypothetical protein
MNLPGFHAEASLYQTTVRYHTVAHDISENLVLPQLWGIDINRLVCLSICGWQCAWCRVTCTDSVECALCELQCGTCAIMRCGGSRS